MPKASSGKQIKGLNGYSVYTHEIVFRFVHRRDIADFLFVKNSELENLLAIPKVRFSIGDL